MKAIEARRFFLSRTLATCGGLTLLTSFTQNALADCKAESRVLGFGASYVDGAQSYNLSIPNWRLGDCELRSALITFRDNIGEFNGEVATHFTHGKDVWHLRLELFTGNPSRLNEQIILLDKSWEGPNMSELDKPLFHTWQFRFQVNPAINLGKVYARATSCC